VAGEELMHPKELEEIERLREQSRRIANGELCSEAVALMRERVPELGENLFLIKHIPEQGEDFYVFVADYRLVISVEISRHGEPSEIEVTPIHEYRHGRTGALDNRTLDAIRAIVQERQGKPRN
jgi:hypothetical protein